MMLRKIIVFFCLIIIFITAFYGRKTLQVAAEEKVFYNVEQTPKIPTMTYEGVTYPDWDNLSFSSLPPSTGDGYFDLSEMASENGLNYEDLVIQLGYDPSRAWEIGTPVENILKLGDLKTNSTLKNWTIENVASYTGIDPSLLNLADFGILNKESLEDVVDAVPLLGEYSLGDVKPFYDLVKNHFGAEKAIEFATSDLASLSDKLEIGTLSLQELDLTQYSLDSIPNLEQAQFGNFLNWEDSFLSEIPGLAQVPMADFILDLVQGGFLAKLDVVWGKKEANRTNTISGSYKEGFKVPCNQENCAHIELTDALPSPTKPLHGKQWISGKSQQVKGGSGLLGSLFGGSEPTGRHPFGDAFKVVLTDTNESTGTASFSVYFRVCGSVFFGPKTCSPYIIGPFPWFYHKEKDLVFVGVDGVDASVPDYLPPVPSQGSIPSSIASQLPPGFEGEGYSPDLGELNFGGTDDCETYKGVNIGALKESVEQIESRGVGGYYAVGAYAPCTGGCTIPGGRALGKYQYMTFREEIQAIYHPQPGGKEILQKSYRRGGISSEELRASIKKYFPPDVQEKVFYKDMKNLISRAYKKGRRGNQIVYQVAGWHHAGGDSFTKWYADDVSGYYKKIIGKYQKKCSSKATQAGSGKCTGKFIRPAKGVRTSGFGGRKHPISGRYKQHNGVDIAAPRGTPILAVDGGETTYTKTGCREGISSCGGGFGNYIKIKHCEGWITVYAHLSKVNIKKGQKVSQGQRIGDMGSTGSSTGPHLHFETHKNGKKLNPEKYLPKL